MAQALVQLEALLTLDDVALALRISRRGVQRLVAAGELQPVRIGSLTRFVPDDVRQLVERQREAVPT